VAYLSMPFQWWSFFLTATYTDIFLARPTRRMLHLTRIVGPCGLAFFPQNLQQLFSWQQVKILISFWGAKSTVKNSNALSA